MAAVARQPSEGRVAEGGSAARLISERGGGVAGNGPVSDRERRAAVSARPARNAADATEDGSELGSQSGTSRDVGTSDASDKEDMSPTAAAEDSGHLEAQIGALHAALKQKDLLIAR